MKILNCNLVQEGAYSGLCDITVEDGIIHEIIPLSAVTKREITDDDIDAAGSTIFPGFIDTHIHGAFGFDTSDGNAEGIIEMAKMLPKFGVRAFCPTTMTTSREVIFGAFEAVKAAQEYFENNSVPHAEILGIHLEGPLLSEEMSGVQGVSDLVIPASNQAYSLINDLEHDFPGLMKIIDIAPELDGAMEFIKKYSDKYVISLAHSGADYSTSVSAFDSGATSVTHLLNAMKPCLKRNPGIQAAAFDKNAYVEVICDGHHIDEAVLRMIFKLHGRDNIIVVSDAMRGSGMPDGKYMLADTEVEVRGGRTYFGPSGNLAGSVTNIGEEVIRLLKFGVSASDITCATVNNPLNRIGLNPQEYLIKPGNKAFLNMISSDKLTIL